MTDELVREVDQAMQQERWQALWRQYGKLVTAGCVAVVLLAAVMVYWQDTQQAARERQTHLLLEARNQISSQRYGDAKQTLDELVEEASGDMRVMAYLWMAKLQLTVDKKAEAIESLASAISQTGEMSSFAALACVQGMTLAPEDERFLSCISRPSPLDGLTKELQAIDKANRSEFGQAAELLPDTSMLPPTQRTRVTDLNAYLTSSVDAQADQ